MAGTIYQQTINWNTVGQYISVLSEKIWCKYNVYWYDSMQI